jgi:hypothetical protein
MELLLLSVLNLTDFDSGAAVDELLEFDENVDRHDKQFRLCEGLFTTPLDDDELVDSSLLVSAVLVPRLVLEADDDDEDEEDDKSEFRLRSFLVRSGGDPLF